MPSVHSTFGAAADSSSASPAGSASSSSTPARLTLAFASRSPISAPGFGVLVISLTGSVVRIHSETRFDSAVAKVGAPSWPTSSSASDQYGVKPVVQFTALGRVLLV